MVRLNVKGDGQKLYHGTGADVLDLIKANGIQPRAKTKVKGNWSHTVTSNKDAVYLTDAYAWHFAANATADKSMKGLILEIDRSLLLPWRLCPDEDFIEQASRKAPPTENNPHLAPTDWSMKKRTLHYRKMAPQNPQLVDKSLEHLGTCGYYDTIPFACVTRYVTIDWDKINPGLWLQAVDTSVHIMNYRILADRHRAFTKWFFGDDVTAAEVSGNAGATTEDGRPAHEVIDLIKQQVERCAKAMQQRDGLTVVNVRQPVAA